MTLLDGWRLAVGTLTAVRVRPPGTVDRATARTAMLLAPLAVVPLGVLVGVVCWAGTRLDLPALASGMLAVGALAAGSRALHLDGLSDVADGLTASYDRERSLAVMKGGTSGPAGVVATVVVLGVQAASLATLSLTTKGAVTAGLLVCLSRVALVGCCARGVPGARAEGLGSTYVGSVPRTAAVGALLVAAGLALAVQGWRGPVGVAVAAVVVALLALRATQRLGGVTGDVFGAAVELALAALLVVGATA